MWENPNQFLITYHGMMIDALPLNLHLASTWDTKFEMEGGWELGCYSIGLILTPSGFYGLADLKL